MISSEKAFRFLRDWKTRKTPLWLFVPDLDALHGPDVRVEDVSEEPLGVVFIFSGSSEVEALDLTGATFDKATPEEAPFPDSVTRRFSFFLHISLSDERKFVVAEYL